MAGNSKERRSHIRIRDRVLLHARPIDQEEYEEKIRSYQEGTDSPWNAFSHPCFARDIKAHVKKIKEKDEALAGCLDILDQKLNFIIGILGKGDEEELAAPTVVDMSAAGIAFFDPQPMEREQLLEIDIGLLPQHIFIRSYGSVVQCQRCDGKYRIGVKFIWMTEDDQDRLIEHIFRHQVIQLRMRRASEERKKK